MIILKTLALILWLVIIPFLMGLVVQRILPSTKKTVWITYICGHLFSFSIFEVVAIGCMLKIKYEAFKFCVLYFMVICLLISAIGIFLTYRKIKKEYALLDVAPQGEDNAKSILAKIYHIVFPGNRKAEPAAFISPRTDVRMMKMQYTKEDFIYWGIFGVILAFQLFMAVYMAPFDGDDAFYVVESLLAQQADVMNTILPDTGISTSLDIRHAMAVFPMWEAFIAKVSGIHATIVAHSILPLVLIPLVYMVYMEIGRILLGTRRDLLPIFMIFIAAFQMFGNTSIYTPETFLMMRTWQGKAMVSSLMIPLVIWLFLWRFDDCRKSGYLWKEETEGGKTIVRNSTWVLLFMVNMTAGITSSMGIVFSTGLAGFLSLFLLLYSKNIKVILKMILAMVPIAVYLLVRLSIRMS